MNTKIFALVLVLAVSVALSGCVGQSGTQGTPNTGTPSASSWCVAGASSTVPAGQAGTVTMTTIGAQDYAFPDGTISVCCFDGSATVDNVLRNVKVCVDRDGEHSVQWWADVGQTLAKLLEMYPKGSQQCIKVFDMTTGSEVSETCQ